MKNITQSALWIAKQLATIVVVIVLTSVIVGPIILYQEISCWSWLKEIVGQPVSAVLGLMVMFGCYGTEYYLYNKSWVSL